MTTAVSKAVDAIAPVYRDAIAGSALGGLLKWLLTREVTIRLVTRIAVEIALRLLVPWAPWLKILVEIVLALWPSSPALPTLQAAYEALSNQFPTDYLPEVVVATPHAATVAFAPPARPPAINQRMLSELRRVAG